jgi:GNAT superfamily N-acetyltransferase
MPLSHVTLQKVETQDAEQLADLRVIAMRESLEQIGRFDATRARERFLSRFAAENTRHILHGKVKVGFVVVRPVDDELLLDHLYVLPEAQCRGIGAAVLAIVFDEADRQSMNVRVGALKDSASNRFYVRHGFCLVKRTEWDDYYLRRSTAV